MKAHVCTYKQTELLYYKLSIWVFTQLHGSPGGSQPASNQSQCACSHFVEEFTINYLYMQTDSQHAANTEQLLCP